jgi:hypothetical protein
MPRLYELASEQRLLLDELVECGGEMSDDLQQRWNDSEDSLGVKLEGVAKAIAELEGDALACKPEIDRLTALKRSRENAAKRLKQYAFDCMTLADKESIRGDLFNFRIQGSAPSARWVGGAADDIPEEFRRVTVEFNAKAALAAFKADETLLADLPIEINRGKHLVIR